MDTNAAKKNGMFGEEPIKVWHDKEWMTLVEMVVSGIELTNTDWVTVRYCQDTWSDAEVTRSSAPKMHKANLVTLKEMAEKPDRDCAHLKIQPAFEAAEVASSPSTAVSLGPAPDVAFDKHTRELWKAVTEAARPKIAAEAMKAKTTRGPRKRKQKSR